MDLSRFSLEGRTAIITGGSGGIGSACCTVFARAGANIVVASLPPESIPPVVQEVEKLGVGGLGIATDVTKADQVDAMVQAVREKFGRIDLLVNVAGGSYSRNSFMPAFRKAPLLEISEHDFMNAYEVNLKSAFLCARAVVPLMKAQGRGAIINIGSISGRGTKREPANMAAYGSAKAAVMNLTFHMAHQWGPEVRVNAIAPGIIDTPRPETPERHASMPAAAKNIGVGRVGTADDVAGVALFLASDASAFVNGSVIDVNGGE